MTGFDPGSARPICRGHATDATCLPDQTNGTCATLDQRFATTRRPLWDLMGRALLAKTDRKVTADEIDLRQIGVDVWHDMEGRLKGPRHTDSIFRRQFSPVIRAIYTVIASVRGLRASTCQKHQHRSDETDEHGGGAFRLPPWAFWTHPDKFPPKGHAKKTVAARSQATRPGCGALTLPFGGKTP